MGEASRRGSRAERIEAAKAAGRIKTPRNRSPLYDIPPAMKAAIKAALGPLTRAKRIEEKAR